MKRVPFVVAVACLGVWAGQAAADTVTPSLKHFLQAHYKKSYDDALRFDPKGDNAPYITTATIAVDAGQKPETAVYVSGNNWCGATGGCFLLVIERTASSYRIIGRPGVIWLPVSVLPTSTHGRPDLSVHEAFGAQDHAARLRFDGIAYRQDPPILPTRKSAGEIVIPGGAKGEALFP